ncbi:hypothetical protein PSYAR_17240 [Pseudomonas syringae pv. aceris str. M302273]|nr:hypothetical protein PSYAR_17240 [Pseudomonas syringae pv. aceris str. M302273]
MGIAVFKEGLQMKVDHDRPLLAYAYLAQTGEQNDILSGLVPIVSPIAQESAGKPFNAVELCEKLENLYGIEIHPWVTEELVPNLVKAGILIPSDVTTGVVRHFYASAERFESISSVETDVRTLVSEFISYCGPLIPTEEMLDDVELEKFFLNQLVSLDFHSALLKPGVPIKVMPEGRGVLSLKREKVEEQSALTAETRRTDRLKLLCAAFIVKLKDDSSKLLGCLVKIASGAIVAEYILNLREPNSTTSLTGMKLYLDGPLVMSYLDLSEPQACIYITVLLERLAAKGAILCIFKHHLEEIADNLRAALATSNQGNGHRATYRRLRQAGFKAYVESVLSNLEMSVRRKKITVVSAPDGPEIYFSKNQQSELSAKLGGSIHARERDAAAIAAVVRLRQGNVSAKGDFHQAQHVFITDNASVARRAALFLREDKIYSDRDVPAAVTDRHLAGLMLVLFGAQASTQLAHQKLIANCASALEPSQELLSSIMTFLSGLDENRAEHFRAIMTTQRSAQYMTRFMLEQGMTLDKVDDAEQVLEYLENKWKDELKAENQQETERVKAEYEDALKLERELSVTAALEKAQVSELLEAHQLESAAKIESNESEILELKKALGEIHQDKIDADQKDLEIAKKSVETKLREAAVKNNALLAVWVRIVACLTMILAGVVTYLAFSPDSPTMKVLIVTLAMVAAIASSTWTGNRVERWKIAKTKREFFDAVNNDYFIQRNIERLKIDYERGQVSIVTPQQNALSLHAEI